MGCDDSEVVDDHEYWGVGVAAADADVVEFAVVSQGDFAAGVDVVVADAVLGAGCGGGCGFGELGVDVCGHCACDAAVGSVVVEVLVKSSSWFWSWSMVLAQGWAVSHFLRVCWNLSLCRRWWGGLVWSVFV